MARLGPASYKITAERAGVEFMAAIRRRGRIIKSDDNCRWGLLADRRGQLRIYGAGAADARRLEKADEG